MAALRSGLFTGEWSERTLRRIAVIGTGAGGALSLALIGWSWTHQFPLRAMFAMMGSLAALPHLLMAFGLSRRAAAALAKAGASGPAAQHLAAAGRCAFTNYIGTTTVVMTALFSGWGLALRRHACRAGLLPLLLPRTAGRPCRSGQTPAGSPASACARWKASAAADMVEDLLIRASASGCTSRRCERRAVFTRQPFSRVRKFMPSTSGRSPPASRWRQGPAPRSSRSARLRDARRGCHHRAVCGLHRGVALKGIRLDPRRFGQVLRNRGHRRARIDHQPQTRAVEAGGDRSSAHQD